MVNDIADEISQRNTTTYPYPPLYVASFPSAPIFSSCCPFSLHRCVENKEDNRLPHPIHWRCRLGCLPCLLRSPIATSTPTMPYPLPHPGLEHEGDERIKKVSFVIAFCIDTSTKQSKLHSPQERTFVLPLSPPNRQFSSQGPSIPSSTVPPLIAAPVAPRRLWAAPRRRSAADRLTPCSPWERMTRRK